MASWLQNRLKAAEELLESVDRQAKSAAVPRSEPLKVHKTSLALSARLPSRKSGMAPKMARAFPPESILLKEGPASL